MDDDLSGFGSGFGDGSLSGLTALSNPFVPADSVGDAWNPAPNSPISAAQGTDPGSWFNTFAAIGTGALSLAGPAAQAYGATLNAQTAQTVGVANAQAQAQVATAQILAAQASPGAQIFSSNGIKVIALFAVVFFIVNQANK